MTAVMIIRVGNTLEFADASGKSLGKFPSVNAKIIMNNIGIAEDDENLRLVVIQNYYQQFTTPAEVQTPVDTPAGFERNPSVAGQ